MVWRGLTEYVVYFRTEHCGPEYEVVSGSFDPDRAKEMAEQLTERLATLVDCGCCLPAVKRKD